MKSIVRRLINNIFPIKHYHIKLGKVRLGWGSIMTALLRPAVGIEATYHNLYDRTTFIDTIPSKT